ncbi:MAG: response regulator, partial [Thermodesulfovibrionales bacterium]|nr:response regulator [Thermodesulfovibrionales bacterium]
AGSIFFVFIMGLALWYTQRVVALNPLEREIALRQEEELRLKQSHEQLEQHVDERTDELKRSEHSYRTLALNLPGIVYRLALGEKKHVLFFNEAVRTMTGFSYDILSPEEGFQKYWNRVPKEDRQRVRTQVRQAIEEDRTFEVEYRFTHASGETRHFLERGRPVLEEGVATYIDGVILDITVSRNSENEAKRLYSTLDTLVNHIPVGIALLDDEHRIVLANPLGKGYLEGLSGAVAGDRLTTLADRPLSDFLISPPHFTRHEITSTGANERTVVYEVAAQTIRGERGVSGTVVLLKDVTEERELRQWAQTHERLAAVGQLASGIAHDFSNILTCVVGFSEMLMSETGNSMDVQRQLRAINESGQRGTDLIGQILDFSRASMDERKPIDLTGAVRDFIRFLDRILPASIKVSVESSEEDHTVLADKTKLQQVFANLAVNARDAMPDGGRLVFGISNITTDSSSREGSAPPLPDMPDGRWVLLSITDSGGGIQEDLCKHIFDPFFTTKNPGKGTGLGLSQVYGIVKQHGGHIKVDSESGHGATFSIYLPQVLDRGVAAGETSDSGEFPRSENRTILVVEDDAVVRGLMVTVLEEMGHTCIEGGDGEEGLRLFGGHAEDIALVVTDLVMPGMNGIQMAQGIREQKPGMDIIAVSGYPPEGDGVDREIFNTFIKKPFKAITFAREVDAVLRAKG